MKKTELNIGQLLELRYEVNAILMQKLSFKHKYWLDRLKDKLNSLLKSYDNLVNSFITEHGDALPNGNFELRATLEDGTINPMSVKLKEETDPLKAEVIELDHPIFGFDLLNSITADFSTPIFYKLIDAEENNA